MFNSVCYAPPSSSLVRDALPLQHDNLPIHQRKREPISNGRETAQERADASAFAMHLTDDAILFAPGMGKVRGRIAIEEAARGMFSQMRVTNFKILGQELEICGDTAYELTTYSETLHPTGAAASDVRGRYLIVWRRGNDGAWRVHRNLFNFDAGGH